MSAGCGRRLTSMGSDQMTATITIDAVPEVVFAVLADPAAHQEIDGTGWVRKPVDVAPILGEGQVFRMAMYHENHPDKDYEIANRVVAFDPPRAIAWKPGTESPDTGQVEAGGWFWRYDLEAAGESQTTVRLTYDWSTASPEAREIIQFPPFPQEHLDRSLQHLADLATADPAPSS
jgi:uncharacterized protein YndB with AHSA1/START domain